NEFHPELAIVDIRMPDLDGFELMARLKARFPALDVILMTGSVDDLDEKLVRAIRSPAFYFIQKPFDREVLKTLVERCVELRWRREDHRQNLTGLAPFSPDRFVTMVAGLISPDQECLRYVNAGHPPIVLWGRTRTPLWLESTGPLVSPVLTASRWEEPVVPIHAGDHVLLYTDGVWDILADEDGRAEAPITSAIDRAPGGGALLLDTLLADVEH